MPKRNKRAFIMPHGAGAANTVCLQYVPVCVSSKQTDKQTKCPQA